jgi:hypothetical protein
VTAVWHLLSHVAFFLLSLSLSGLPSSPRLAPPPTTGPDRHLSTDPNPNLGTLLSPSASTGDVAATLLSHRTDPPRIGLCAVVVAALLCPSDSQVAQ